MTRVPEVKRHLAGACVRRHLSTPHRRSKRGKPRAFAHTHGPSHTTRVRQTRRRGVRARAAVQRDAPATAPNGTNPAAHATTPADTTSVHSDALRAAATRAPSEAPPREPPPSELVAHGAPSSESLTIADPLFTPQQYMTLIATALSLLPLREWPLTRRLQMWLFGVASADRGAASAGVHNCGGGGAGGQNVEDWPRTF